VHVQVSTDLPPVAADRALLRRVLSNLLANALRHSGSPTVHVEATALAGAHEVALAVRDHGRGIDPQLHARIFEKFAALPRSPADEPFRDTGLGLPFCKLAIEEMGGRIAIIATPGGGATFTVTLPAHTRA
jgi:signal transduction histidine kinase